ncbi:hypothetical protein MNBD_PLANCTO03-2085 [hydrothermal vent metagenome]|uniref:Uncharacterized protein n=1 Tax=hydrothermal vent metagenome TaxID=652676 RepID=A0A3B1E917_9ZZZZ
MKLTHRLAMTIAACGLATTAFAQDSVSPTGMLPGDALEVYDATEACNAYVVDAVDFTASWGTALRIAPVLKAPRMPASGFFNNLISAHAISHDLLTMADYPTQSYGYWTVPGAGINNLINDSAEWIPPTYGMDIMQFGVTLADFGTSLEGASYNGIHSAIINVDTADDSRLWVYRVSTAINGPTGAENNAQMGVGVIDANGNMHFRVDDFNLGGTDQITGQNIFRTRILDRTCGLLNTIGGTGGSDASDWLVVSSATTHVVPNAIPASIAGRPVYGGVNFDGLYGYEVSPGVVVYTPAHSQGATDNRGTNGASITPWFGGAGAVAAYALQGKTAGADTDAVSIWDVDASGNVVNPGALLTVPSAPTQGGSITDNNDGYVIGGPVGWDLDGYHSQTPYRGGSGSVALTVAPAGERLVASTAYDNAIGGGDNPSNAVVVGKHDTGTGTTTWTLAGYYDANTDTGKAIKDGPGGNTIGVMTGMFKVTGGAPLGPSISQPAFDCAGNVYFVAAVELFGDLGSDFDVALVRAVYNPAAFDYELELIAQSGDVHMGNNSATPYAITFIDLADSNSISSGSFFASNVMSDCWAGATQADLDGSTDPRAVGGVVLNARITYDTDGDGMFDNALDENYRSLLLITGTGAADPCSYADYNNNGTVNTQDFLAFLNDWNAGNTNADCNEDGAVNTLDFVCFLSQWANCR